MRKMNHPAIDDIALMRALPNMTVIEPADVRQVPAAVQAAVAHDGPVYLRLRRADGPPPEPLQPTPLVRGQLDLLRDGNDGVILACGLMCATALAAADQLAAQGLSVAVANVATLKPLDEDALLESAAKTGRVVIVQEAPRTAGFGAELAAILAEKAILDLRGPVIRVTGYDVPYPYWSIEDAYMPSVARVVDAARRLLEY